MRWACWTARPWTSSMSTSEYRSVDAESDLPISAANSPRWRLNCSPRASDLARTAHRRRGPVAPRGNVPDTTAAGVAGTAAGSGQSVHRPPAIPLTDVYVPAPTSPEPDGVPADRAGRTARQRAGYRRPRRRRDTRPKAHWTPTPSPRPGWCRPSPACSPGPRRRPRSRRGARPGLATGRPRLSRTSRCRPTTPARPKVTRRTTTS